MKLFSNSVFRGYSADKPKLILLHGSAIQLIRPNQGFSEISLDQVRQEYNSKPKPLVLLASPFVNSFVHETIPLSTKDLESVDRQTLGFSPSPGDRRLIASIELQEKKALTVHSHLTGKGMDLLTYFKQIKIKIKWQPAVQTLIKSLLYFPQTTVKRKTKLRIYLFNEMLQVRWHTNYAKFQHLSYWHQQLDFPKKKLYVDRMLAETTGQSDMVSAVLHKGDGELTDESVSDITEIFFPKGKRQKRKTLSQAIGRERGDYWKLITVNRILALIVVCLILWAIAINYHANGLKEYRAALKKSVDTLQVNSDKLNVIAETEREYFKLSSLVETANSLKLRPYVFLEKLDSILPSGVWIFRFSISSRMIVLELLDDKETELTTLIEMIGTRLGKTNLEKNETIQIGNKILKKYSILINQFQPEPMNEKVD
ncbi:MAG: hypothetical protein GY866_05620 [Proteobacteria bacterium]|nr:hypothetical protein [Pseudomonadota bacterium]